MIRRVLRQAGLRYLSERCLNGFAVEGANASEDGDEPLSVAYRGSVEVPETMGQYRRALERAGLLVSVDPQDEQVLLVARRSVASVRRMPYPGRALLGVAVVCAVLAAVALVASWVASGRTRLVGGVCSGVLGCLAVGLAGLWYRRGLADQERSARDA
jgi:hypothetical protein